MSVVCGSEAKIETRYPRWVGRGRGLRRHLAGPLSIRPHCGLSCEDAGGVVIGQIFGCRSSFVGNARRSGLCRTVTGQLELSRLRVGLGKQPVIVDAECREVWSAIEERSGWTWELDGYDK